MAVSFSNRLSWHHGHNQLSQVLGKMKSQVISDLTISNPHRAGFLYPESLQTCMANSGATSYVPDSKGLPSAREAIAEYYQKRGRSISPNDIFVTCSTSEAYSWLFKLLCDPGDNVLVSTPSYPLFDDLAGLESVRVRNYRSAYDGGQWLQDTPSLNDAYLPSTRAVLLVNPNNPTGHFVSDDAWEELKQLQIPLIVDEVFADYASDGCFDKSLAGRGDADNFILSGLSKVCGLPNMKLGWIVVQGPNKEEIKQRLDWIADTYLSPSSPVQCALPQLFRIGSKVRMQITARINENRGILATSGLNVLKNEGGWYSIIQMPSELDDEHWALNLLVQKHIHVHPGYFYGLPMESCIVVSLLPQTDSFKMAIEQIAELSQKSAKKTDLTIGQPPALC